MERNIIGSNNVLKEALADSNGNIIVNGEVTNTIRHADSIVSLGNHFDGL